jgi:hypothetical protein
MEAEHVGDERKQQLQHGRRHVLTVNLYHLQFYDYIF